MSEIKFAGAAAKDGKSGERPSFPLTRPNAPKLSAYAEELQAIEDSHWLSNYGPVNSRLEQRFTDELFNGVGACLTVANATIGLMIAVKLAAERSAGKGRYVLMPSFTFAAAAHAGLWAGLTPLLIDIDPDDWAASAIEEERMLRQYGDEIAVIMPYATFGNCIDLAHYDRLSEQYNVPVVVDAAASLGSIDDRGLFFGTGSRHIIVFSMHATKAFGVGECGMLYSGDKATIDTLRRMGNFGFGAERSAEMPGLNSKISEVVAFSALVKLSDFEAQISHRSRLAEIYLQELPDWTAQRTHGHRVAYQFMPLLMPASLAPHRKIFQRKLAELGVGTGCYFSPHINQQPYFQRTCIAGELPVTNEIGSRILSLPVTDFMTVDEVSKVCALVRETADDLISNQLKGENA